MKIAETIKFNNKKDLPLITQSESINGDQIEISHELEKSAAFGFAKLRVGGIWFRYLFAGLNAIALIAMNVPILPIAIWSAFVILSQLLEYKLGKKSLANLDNNQDRKNFYNAGILSAIIYSSVAPIGWFMGGEWAKMCVIWFIVGSIVANAGVQHRVPIMKAKLIAPYILIMPILGGIELYLNWKTDNLPVFALYLMFLTGSVFFILMVRVNFTSSNMLNEVFKENEIARIKAENANIAKSHFVSSISHDLRNPLNAILGAANLLKRNAKTPEDIQLLDTLLQSGQSMIGLLNDILDHAKLEAGKIDFDIEAFNPKSFMEDSVAIWLAIANEKKINLIIKLDEDLPKALMGDKQRIGQIVNNLISNAIKFTPIGEVSVLCFYENNNLIIKVKDTGIGINENELNNLFTPFVQASAKTNTHFGGTGLGLSNSKKLAEAMKGKILVKSAKNIGSEFWVELPLKTTNQSDIQIEKEIVSPDGIFNGDNSIRILAADDNAANLFIIGKFLETIGANIDLVNDGKEAVKKASVKVYDVILLDVRMPIMDGITACRKIRTECIFNKDTPIIMISADAEKDQIEIGLNAGADTYLPKPIVPNKLFEIIEASLNGREAFSKVA